MSTVRAITACGIFHEAEAGAEEMAAILGKTMQMPLAVRHSEVVRISLKNRV